MPSLNQRVLKAVPIFLPPEGERKELADLLKPLVAKAECSREKGEALTKLKGHLLGKLLSGELSVGEMNDSKV